MSRLSVGIFRPYLEEFSDYPTNPFTILEPQEQEIGDFYIVQEHRASDFQAP